ncbi:MAG: diadenosine tetraphosphate (Ap4A) HIT family hydrolase [Alteromonadaceae bacterium]|jgi:diadenosine tetraphosphate (Ap4A) HIT family hydrolase|tara:strand:- start:875 stop:1294 length:420 start_codon:yes stop_codon:yes gene_type:complete
MENIFSLHPQLSKDCIVLTDLPLCKVLLCNDKAYPWFILVPRIADVTEIYQLEWQDQQQFLNESSLLSELLMAEFNGDKLNVAALGNVVPQLHIHHIVRFKDDFCWPKPIWGQHPLTPYSIDEIESIKKRIQPKISLFT